jgi:hypothetical protein
MCSQGHSTNWSIASSISSKTHFCFAGGRK